MVVVAVVVVVADVGLNVIECRLLSTHRWPEFPVARENKKNIEEKKSKVHF